MIGMVVFGGEWLDENDFDLQPRLDWAGENFKLVN